MLSRLFGVGNPHGRLASMEGLRGLAILMVFTCHYIFLITFDFPMSPGWREFERVVGELGGCGVDLFFLLSGFLIYRTALKPNLRYGAFMRRRFERIYPTFAVVLTLYYVLSAIRVVPFRGPHSLGGGAAYVLANALFLPGLFDIHATISAAWSLSYEWAFYLTIPLFVRALRLGAWRAVDRIALFAIVAALWAAVTIFAPHIFPLMHWWDPSRVRSIMFLCGMIVYELIGDRPVRSISRGVQAALLAVGVVAGAGLAYVKHLDTGLLHRDAPYAVISLGGVQSALLFIICFALGLAALPPDGLLARPFRTTWLRWLGNMSYSFYLIHSLALHVTGLAVVRANAHRPGTVVEALVLYPLTFLFTAAVSTVLFACVEKPLSLGERGELTGQSRAAA